MSAEAPIIVPGELEKHSLWYRYKTQVWPEQTAEAVTAHNIMRVIRGMHFQGDVAYVSLPINSGKHFYDAVLANRTEFTPLLKDAVVNDNYLDGLAFLSDLQKRRDCPIIFPADFGPIDQRWEQPHFQTLWLEIIAEKATELHMEDRWEYGSGCIEEFTHAMQLRLGLPQHKDLTFYNTKGNEVDERKRMRSIRVFDHLGNPLTIDNGIEAVGESLNWLRGYSGWRVFRDFATGMEGRLNLLQWTKEQLDRGFYQ